VRVRRSVPCNYGIRNSRELKIMIDRMKDLQASIIRGPFGSYGEGRCMKEGLKERDCAWLHWCPGMFP